MAALVADSRAIRDQRTMVGYKTHATVADVEEAWQDWADRMGLTGRRREGDNSTELRRSSKTVVAYVSGSRWVADCPNCNGGIPCWSENPRGCCLDCGTIFKVDFPKASVARRVERILLERKRESERSWHRHLGEPIADLERENKVLEERDAAESAAALDTVAFDLTDVERVLGAKAAEKMRAGIA